MIISLCHPYVLWNGDLFETLEAAHWMQRLHLGGGTLMV
jgi:hypothetical protein